VIQVILTKEQLDLIGELRGIHIAIGALLTLVKKGVMDKDEALKRMGKEIIEVEKIWNKLRREGI
jgi:hypothetical protein